MDAVDLFSPVVWAGPGALPRDGSWPDQVPEVIRGAFITHAFEGGRKVYRRAKTGSVTCTQEEFVGAVTQLFDVTPGLVKGGPNTDGTIHLLVSDEACISLQINSQRWCMAEIITTSSRLVEEFSVWARAALRYEPPASTGPISILRYSGSELCTDTLGDIGSPIERCNYTKDVCALFDRAVEDLKADEPRGRLVVMDGPPGTGKTFMLRHIIFEAHHKAKFLLMSPSTVVGMGAPAFGTLLMDLAAEAQQTKQRNVLVLEDADECLAPRGPDNIASISTLLNLSDGILGRAVDIRVIVTTNARQSEIDPAVLRPGRLSERISIGPLDPKQANIAYAKLVGSDALCPYGSPTTIAQVYRDAKRPASEQEVAARSPRKVGF